MRSHLRRRCTGLTPEAGFPLFRKTSSDGRGEVFDIGDLGEFHISALTIMKGKVRGGHYHDFVEKFSLVYGALEFHSGFENRDKVVVFRAGETVSTTPNVPHYFLALEDSVAIEFRPRESQYNPTDYEPFRKLARASMK